MTSGYTKAGADAALAPKSTAWQASTAVKAGQLLTNAGVLYRVTTDMTTPGSFNTTNLAALGGAVSSVNGNTGVVVLAASDVGADASGAASTAQTAAIAAAATDATTKANAAQAAAVQRSNHTGTQSADTLTDGTTNKAFLATERTKLAGIATGATANSSDAVLEARANHTGTQLMATISDAGGAATKNVGTTAGTVAAGDDSRFTKTLPGLIRAVTVAYAATVTPNADTTDILNVGTLTGNITLANPTGTPVDGQMLRFRMVQDATGSRTFAFGTAYAFGTDVPQSVIPATANADFELLFSWCARVSKWRALAPARGF